MRKIFGYELRRPLWNKLFFGVLLVSLGLMLSSVIRSAAHTAPFSPWNFGYYLSQVLPLICLGGSVLSLVLLFQGGAFASAPDPGRPGQAAAIHGPALRGGTDAGPLPPCSALSSHGGGIFVIFAVNMQNYKSVKDKQPGENLIF